MKTGLFLAATAFAAITLSMPASAQSIGGGGGVGGGGIGGGGGVGGAAGVGGGVSPSLGSAANTVNSSGGVGSDTTSTQQRATAGTTTLNSVNADAVARTGDVGAASTIGGSSGGLAGTTTASGFQSVAGAGPEALYNIPRARVNVDLDAIRSGLRNGPNATPDSYGN